MNFDDEPESGTYSVPSSVLMKAEADDLILDMECEPEPEREQELDFDELYLMPEEEQ